MLCPSCLSEYDLFPDTHYDTSSSVDLVPELASSACHPTTKRALAYLINVIMNDQLLDSFFKLN